MNAYIFDVDGVITNPSLKKVQQKEILLKIAALLENQIVALNTGRSLEWLIERVINPLSKIVANKKTFQSFYAICEKGGTWLSVNNEGVISKFRDEKISVPQQLQEKIKKLIELNFSNTTFFDDTKETMVSTEMIDGQDPEHEYRTAQKHLVTELRKILEKEGLDKNFKIDPTTIATDVENMIVGKDFAVKRIIDWFKSKNIKPEKIIALGDSKSDIPMAEEIYRMGYALEFVFVGQELLGNKYPFKITYTKEKYDKGTLEYLNQQ